MYANPVFWGWVLLIHANPVIGVVYFILCLVTQLNKRNIYFNLNNLIDKLCLSLSLETFKIKCKALFLQNVVVDDEWTLQKGEKLIGTQIDD